MFFNCLLFTFLLSFSDGQFQGYHDVYYRNSGQSCPPVSLRHGRVRLRQRFKLARFVCDYRYELVGNRYGTCRNGEWDTQLPVCVRSGCEPLSEIKNGAQMVSHRGAWVVVFCYPGYKLVGSSSIYCDGYSWNTTAPSCVDSTVETKLSCDFEDPGLCGWSQDELHDFDWIRLNKRTPSTFLNTGPSFDHTYGSNGTGYYMYIESTSRLENDTARLISPIYDVSHSQDACFQFFYHMYGKRTGGLRVYQKPESLQITALLNMIPDDKQKFILFDLWGNQGDMWYSAVPLLRNLNDSFQIIIEGIRGKGYTSDIAIDDVAILHGEKCTEAAYSTIPTPTTISDSCSGRCGAGANADRSSCGCNASCISGYDCCLDYLELCVFNLNNTKADDDSKMTPETPLTEKLIASSLDTFTTEETTKQTSTTTTTTPKPTTSTTTTTAKPTTTTTKATTTPKLTTTPKPTTTPTTTTTEATTTTTKRATTVKSFTTTARRTAIPVSTSKVVRPPTTTALKQTTVTKPTMTTKPITTSVPITSKLTTKEMTTNTKVAIQQNVTTFAGKQPNLADATQTKGHSHANATVVAIIGVICFITLITVVIWRTGKGRVTLARLRGRVSNDPEVRYLNSAVDD